MFCCTIWKTFWLVTEINSEPFLLCFCLRLPCSVNGFPGNHSGRRQRSQPLSVGCCRLQEQLGCQSWLDWAGLERGLGGQRAKRLFSELCSKKWLQGFCVLFNFGLNYLKHFKLYNKYKFTHDLLEEAECLQRLYALNPQNMQACECANMHDKSEFHMWWTEA